MNREFNNLASRVKEESERLQKTLKPILDAQSKFLKSIEPIQETIKNFQISIAPILKQQQEFIELIERLEKDKEGTRDVMLQSGWWLTPSLMDVPAHWITNAVTKYQNGNKRAIFDLFKKVYQSKNCEHLEHTVTSWSKSTLFKPWEIHILDALFAHKNKQYNLSIPVLLLVAEGVASEFCKKNSISVGRSKSKEKIQNAVMAHYRSSNNLLLSDLDLLQGALDTTIYQNTSAIGAKLRKNILNRHAVMHGIKKDYGKMKTSLQAFMLLDMLGELE